MDPGVVGALIPIVALIVGGAIAIFAPLARAHARHLDKQGWVPPEIASRLERMEQSIEAIALEVERISEGQRFTTKLLSERTSADGGPPAIGAGAGSVVPAAERRS